MTQINISSSARIIGDITTGEGGYLAQGTIIRSENDGVTLGDHTWILENSVIIGSKEDPVEIGSKTVLGHKCLVVGATIGSWCEVGNNVIMLPGARIGDWCIFGEGTLISEGMNIPNDSVVVGRPGKIIRKLADDDRAMIKKMRGNDIIADKKEGE